jgi:hypothetical protein
VNFKLHWSPKALDRLADLWWAAPERQAIVDAIERINSLLRVDPAAHGESRDGGRRILLEFPLGVLYQLGPTANVVEILIVWQFDKRKK